MLVYLSNHLVDFLLHKGAIRQEDRDIYVYGYQIIISSMFGIILVCILGVLLKRLPESLTFLVVFIITRQYCGGYHAGTFFKCCVLFIFSYLTILLLMKLIIDRIVIYQIICLLLIYIVTIFKYAPVENENKMLSDKTKALNRKKSIALSLFWSLIIIVLYSRAHVLFLIIILTLILVSIFILIVEFRKEGQEHEKVAGT